MQTYQNQQGMNQQPAPMGLSDQELAYDLLYQEKALMANISSEVACAMCSTICSCRSGRISCRCSSS